MFVAILIALPGFDGEAKNRKGDDEKVNVGAGRPFDAVNIFSDFGRDIGLPNTEEHKLWWERMVRGEVDCAT